MQANNVIQALTREASSRGSVAPEAAISHLMLHGGALWSKSLHAENRLAVRCEEGAVWITQEGVGDDFILGSGETIQLHGPGLVVLSAFKSAAVVTSCVPMAA